jgi:hypothetical protein
LITSQDRFSSFSERWFLDCSTSKWAEFGSTEKVLRKKFSGLIGSLWSNGGLFNKEGERLSEGDCGLDVIREDSFGIDAITHKDSFGID